MRGHQQGERERRFLGLLERNRDRVERICRSWSAGAADRDDLRAEIHYQLWRSLPSFDGQSSEDTWLFRVALNTALLQARRRDRRCERPVAETVEIAAAGERGAAPAAHRHLEEDERRRRLLAAVHALPPVDRTLVTLWLEELPYAEIAEITGLTESHVGVRLHRARKRLAAQLTAGEA